MTCPLRLLCLSILLIGLAPMAKAAPIHEKAADAREVYLPEGIWYDFWNQQPHTGGRTVTRKVDLGTMPIYVRAGTILPVDPIRQYTANRSISPSPCASIRVPMAPLHSTRTKGICHIRKATIPSPTSIGTTRAGN